MGNNGFPHTRAADGHILAIGADGHTIPRPPQRNIKQWFVAGIFGTDVLVERCAKLEVVKESSGSTTFGGIYLSCLYAATAIADLPTSLGHANHSTAVWIR